MTDEVRKEVADLLDEYVQLTKDKRPETLDARIKRHGEIAERLRTILDLPRH
jgi:hypothetical protein